VIDVIQADQRFHIDRGWLSAYWLFSFDEYHDPANLHWSVLRVFNDDTIQPGQGFGFHPHRDMEIFTYVLEGELEHKDSLGNVGVVRAGEIQVMSAGTGITHAEFNQSRERAVHLLQLWILPRTKGLKPRWQQWQVLPEQRAGKLLPVVSDGTIDQKATIYLSRLAAGQSLDHQPGPRAFLYVMEGGLNINQRALRAGDQARIAGENALSLEASADSELILLDLP
jgi:redox-sensitive bicupin YhaK (pirin superfamily)